MLKEKVPYAEHLLKNLIEYRGEHRHMDALNTLSEYTKQLQELLKFTIGDWITIANNAKTGKIVGVYCKHCDVPLGSGHEDNCEVQEKLNKIQELL